MTPWQWFALTVSAILLLEAIIVLPLLATWLYREHHRCSKLRDLASRATNGFTLDATTGQVTFTPPEPSVAKKEPDSSTHLS